MATGHKNCQKISFDSLCEHIRPGDRIFISSGSATPMKTISMIMESKHPNLIDLWIIQFILPEMRFFLKERQPHKYLWKTFSVGEAIVQGMQTGKTSPPFWMDFIPSNMAEIPYLFHSNALDVNVAIVQTSPPDNKGFVSLGIVSDVADLVLKNAPIAIAEINPTSPLPMEPCPRISISLTAISKATSRCWNCKPPRRMRLPTASAGMSATLSKMIRQLLCISEVFLTPLPVI
ncbi:MAG: hypothetical protein WBN66_13870 [Smithella sp.]